MRRLLALGVVVLSGCFTTGGGGGTGEPERVCEPGDQKSCACEGGALGAQTCEADGEGWGVCRGCGGASASTSSTTNSSTSSNSEISTSASVQGSTSGSSSGSSSSSGQASTSGSTSTSSSSASSSSSGSPVCGDNTRNGNETCDGDDFGGVTCRSLGFGDGTLECISNCTEIDSSNCPEPTLTAQNARRISTDVVPDFGGLHVSEDGQWLLYSTNPHEDGYSTIKLMRLSDGNIETLSTDADAPFGNPFSPDSSFLYYVSGYRSSFPSDGTFELWLHYLNGNQPVMLGDHVLFNSPQYLTENGSHLIFGRSPTSFDIVDLHVADTSDGSTRLIDTNVKTISLSPGGNYVTYYKNASGDSAELWIAPVAQGSPRMLSATAHYNGQYNYGVQKFTSGDTQLLFVDNFVPGTSGSVKRVNTASGSPTTVVNTFKVSVTGTLLVHFSNDGTQLMYWSTFDEANQRGTAHAQNVSGGNPVTLGSNVGHSWTFDFTFPNLFYLDDYVPYAGAYGGSGTLKLYRFGDAAPQLVATNVGAWETASDGSWVISMTDFDPATYQGTMSLVNPLDGSTELVASNARNILIPTPDGEHAALWVDYDDNTKVCGLQIIALPDITPKHELTRVPHCYNFNFIPSADRVVYMANTDALTSRGDVTYSNLDGSDGRVLVTNAVLGYQQPSSDNVFFLLTTAADSAFGSPATLSVVHADTGASVDAADGVSTLYLRWIPGTHTIVYSVDSGNDSGIWAVDVEY